jgi:hypothetical protein
MGFAEEGVRKDESFEKISYAHMKVSSQQMLAFLVIKKLLLLIASQGVVE